MISGLRTVWISRMLYSWDARGQTSSKKPWIEWQAGGRPPSHTTILQIFAKVTLTTKSPMVAVVWASDQGILVVVSIFRVFNSIIVGVQMAYSSEPSLLFWVGTKFELPNGFPAISISPIFWWLNWSLGSLQVRFISKATVMRLFGMSTSRTWTFKYMVFVGTHTFSISMPMVTVLVLNCVHGGGGEELLR